MEWNQIEDLIGSDITWKSYETDDSYEEVNLEIYFPTDDLNVINLSLVLFKGDEDEIMYFPNSSLNFQNLVSESARESTGRAMAGMVRRIMWRNEYLVFKLYLKTS
ncbi:hypothetical protein DMUE_1792 [Dictyocoela muelleri]|nr:hypothetical protein DMUE_1792 [Dictyocoela muelleri]